MEAAMEEPPLSQFPWNHARVGPFTLRKGVTMTTLVLTEKDYFEAWLRELEDICQTELGFSYQDLEEQPYKDWFNDGFTAEDAFYKLAEHCYLGVEFENIQTPNNSISTREFDTFSDSDPGL
jgi:hypothetical protein